METKEVFPTEATVKEKEKKTRVQLEGKAVTAVKRKNSLKELINCFYLPKDKEIMQSAQSKYGEEIVNNKFNNN